MRWLGRRESDNVEFGSGGGGMGGKLVGGGIGTLVIGLIIYLLGGNPSEVLNSINMPGQQQEETYKKTSAELETRERFASVVLAETEEVWGKVFSQMGRTYQEPALHMFDGAVTSACGYASNATGPFYCPGDQKIYLDKTFFDELRTRFKADGDFANAYVIAHEVGHHVQEQLGTTAKFAQMRAGLSEKKANRLSVMMELQADFYAGVWAHYANKAGDLIEAGDIEEALNAASAIGDDRLQKQAQGTIVPEAFTHGTSEQRVYWFKKGFETGDISQGNTFEELSRN